MAELRVCRQASRWLALLVIPLLLGIASCSQRPEAGSSKATAAGSLAGSLMEPAALVKELTVFRSPTCSCCGEWIAHMESHGFRIIDQITEDMDTVKQRYGVPAPLASCHTTVADGYVIEGHVPAEDVARLLKEKPAVAGIAVPGMPIGSPGMESGDYREPYAVVSFTQAGEALPYAEHP